MIKPNHVEFTLHVRKFRKSFALKERDFLKCMSDTALIRKTSTYLAPK